MSDLEELYKDVDPDVLNVKKFLVLIVPYSFGRLTEGDIAKILNRSWDSLYSCMKKLEELDLYEQEKLSQTMYLER